MSNLKLQMTAIIISTVLTIVVFNQVSEYYNIQIPTPIRYFLGAIAFAFITFLYPTNILKHIKITQDRVKTTAQITKINSVVSGMCNAKVTYSDNNNQYTQDICITYFAYKNKYREGDIVKVYYSKKNPELVMFAGMNLFMEFVNKHYEYRIAFSIITCTLFSIVVFSGFFDRWGN